MGQGRLLSRRFLGCKRERLAHLQEGLAIFLPAGADHRKGVLGLAGQRLPLPRYTLGQRSCTGQARCQPHAASLCVRLHALPLHQSERRLQGSISNACSPPCRGYDSPCRMRKWHPYHSLGPESGSREVSSQVWAPRAASTTMRLLRRPRTLCLRQDRARQFRVAPAGPCQAAAAVSSASRLVQLVGKSNLR